MADYLKNLGSKLKGMLKSDDEKKPNIGLIIGLIVLFLAIVLYLIFGVGVGGSDVYKALPNTGGMNALQAI